MTALTPARQPFSREPISSPVRQERKSENAKPEKTVLDFQFSHVAVLPALSSDQLRQCRTETDRHCRPFRTGEVRSVLVSRDRGSSCCVQPMRSVSIAHAKPNDSCDRALPKLSVKISDVLPRCFGRSRRRHVWQQSPSAMSATPNDFSAVNTNRRSRLFSRSSTKCSANKPNSICNYPARPLGNSAIHSNRMKGWRFRKAEGARVAN